MLSTVIRYAACAAIMAVSLSGCATKSGFNEYAYQLPETGGYGFACQNDGPGAIRCHLEPKESQNWRNNHD